MNFILLIIYILTLSVTVDLKLDDDFLLLMGMMTVSFLVQFVFISVGLYSLRSENHEGIRFRDLIMRKQNNLSDTMIKRARSIVRKAHEAILASGFICWAMTVFFISKFIPNSVKIKQMFHFPILWILLPLILLFFIDNFVFRRTAWLYDANSMHKNIGNPWKNWLKLQIAVTLFLIMNYEVPSISSELWIILAVSFPVLVAISCGVYLTQAHLAKKGRV